MLTSGLSLPAPFLTALANPPQSTFPSIVANRCEPWCLKGSLMSISICIGDLALFLADEDDPEEIEE